MYTEEAFEIPREKLNTADVNLLAELSLSYTQIDTEEGRKIAELFSRLYRGTGETVPLPEMSVRTTNIRVVIETCIRNSQDIQITYIDAGNKRSVRRITPLRVFQWSENELVEGWCHLRNQNRQFRLDRITEIMSAGETDPEIVSAKATGTDRCVEETTIIIDTEERPLPYQRKPFTAEIRTGPYLQDSRRYIFYESKNLFSWLLKHSPAFEIRTPKWLREKAERYFKNQANIHHG
jgi:predicted DNA-binding transcriptional regulator YafY